MEALKSFKEFVNESTEKEIIENAIKLAFSCVYESETGEVTVTVNEGFVQDLQMHIRKTIDILIDEYGVKANKIDKYLEKNLEKITSSFKKGEEPADTAKAIA